jgi:hypothetical protein
MSRPLQTLSLSSAGIPRFALFLRPFSITRRLAVKNPYASVGYLWPGAANEPKLVDLETLLADAFSSDNPLVGLGEPGEAIGVGRVRTSEQDWREAVKKMAPAAQNVLVVPSAKEGTKWEIEYLKEQGLLSKCVFIMPPSRDIEIVQDWKSSIGKVPVEMPPHDPAGLLYSVNANGQIVKTAPLSVGTTRSLVTQIASVSMDPNNHSLTYKISDQPAARVIGLMVIYPVAMVFLGILFIIIILVVLQMSC